MWMTGQWVNKHRQENKMTTPQPVNVTIILQTFLRSRSFQAIRLHYKINYHIITTLVGCYLYCTYVSRSFAISTVATFISYYDYHRTVRFINRLIECNLITQAGTGKHNHYTISPEGLQVIHEISNKADNNLYTFCNKYNIEL